jgi:hypothetical protein
VSRVESHTVTTGYDADEVAEFSELRINDFRRIYSKIVSRSVSASLPTFFAYVDHAGRYQGLRPGALRIVEGGPFLTSYTMAVSTPDGAVSGQIHCWQAAHADRTRLFTELELEVHREVTLSETAVPPLVFLRHHTFNPMAFGRFVFLGREGVVAGDLPFARRVPANGTALAAQAPFGLLYAALNELDQGRPCSDITGNTGWVLLAWDARAGDDALDPGVYVFGTGPDDDRAPPFSRDLAVVPVATPPSLPAGSRFRYRALSFVDGDSSDTEALAEEERLAWGLHPLSLHAEHGWVLSDFPPSVRARDGEARFVLSGGCDWVPVRVFGLPRSAVLRGWIDPGSGVEEELKGGTDGECWYSLMPDGPDHAVASFLVRTAGDGAPVRVRVRCE